MRFGGPFIGKYTDPESWSNSLKEWGFRSTFCPLPIGAPDADIKAVKKAAQESDIVIAEVGVWNNPIDVDPAKRRIAMDACKAGLALADEIGARCCVNCAGTLNPEHWFGPHPDNFTDRGFNLVVESIREIIDSVKPVRTWYTLEPMGFILPDSTQAYLEIIKAVDRERFAVHFDPVNLINSPRKYFRSGDLVKEFVQTLGQHIRSCHIKDLILTTDLTVNLKEIRAGLGGFDCATFLREIRNLDPDMPVLMEHLENEGEYRLAASYIRSVIKTEGISL